MIKYLALMVVSSILFGFSASVSKQEVLDEKVAQMIEWSRRKPIIKLTSSKYSTYVKIKPRNYSVIVMFTALNPKRGCSVCEEANNEFNILANSFRFSASFTNSLFFAVMDFDDGPDVFQSLNLRSAPAFMHFPAKGKRKSADTYEIQRLGFQADNVAKWVAERTEVIIRVFRPPNYAGTIIAALFFILAGTLLYVQRNSLEFLFSKKFWGLIAIVTTLAMTSGQMWNHIRGPPYYHRNPRSGSISYIHGSSQGQLVAETHIIMAIHAAVVVGFVLLNEARNDNIDVKKRRIIAIIGLIVVIFFFSTLMSVFRMKYHGYPYSLLFR